VGLHGTVALAVGRVYTAGLIVIKMSSADHPVSPLPAATMEEPDLLVEAKLGAGSGDAGTAGAFGLNTAHVHDGIGIGDVGIGGADALVVARRVGTVDGIETAVFLVLVVGDTKDLTVFAKVRTAVLTLGPGIDVVSL